MPARLSLAGLARLAARLAGLVGSVGRGGSSSSFLACWSATARRRSCSAANCTTVRDHTTRAQWNVNAISTNQATSSPTAGPGWPAPAVWRVQTASRPSTLAVAEPASATHATAQRRVVNASIEKPTPNTSASQPNTRIGRVTSAASAVSEPNNTSQPRTSPVCGRMNDPSSTKTRTATTTPRPPGSISPAMRRSTRSRSLR